MLLHDAAHHETATPTPAADHAVAIIEVQELATPAALPGERTLERQLHELELRLVASLPAGDGINARATAPTSSACCTVMQRRSRSICIEQVYLCADHALTKARDAASQPLPSAAA